MSNALARRFQYIVDQISSGNKKQFAELTGKSASQIYKICRGASQPSMRYLQALHESFSVDITWLLTGQQPEGGVHNIQPQSQDIAHAPIYDVSASAGLGSDVSSEEINDYFTFNKQWLSRYVGVSEDQLAMINVRGDSMEPTLFHGDSVLVDLNAKSVAAEGIYCLQSDHGLLIKRLKFMRSNEIQVQSDNEAYEDWLINEQNSEAHQIMGRVVWCSRILN